MTEPFRIQVESQVPAASIGRQPASPFCAVGFSDNPFPPAGLDWGVLYVDHMRAEVEALNDWFESVDRALENKSAVRPVALEGALGVGKTHLLSYIGQHLERNSQGSVTRKALTDHGMTRLVLSNLLVTNLPVPSAPAAVAPRTSIPLLEEVMRKLQGDPRGHEKVSHMTNSPLQAPLRSLLDPPDDKTRDEGVVWLGRWLSRAPTTPSQRARLMLKGTLDSEGEAIRAIADLVSLARSYEIIRCWYFMIDQLEELWRPGVITFGRRARFLTDLRSLVDLALEGAPIAVVAAWNTQVEVDSLRDRLKREYAALARRLGEPLRLPGLQERDIEPFAKKYLTEAEKRLGIPDQTDGDMPKRFRRELLKGATRAISGTLRKNSLATLGDDRYSTAFVLDAWRNRAADVVRDLAPSV